MTTFAHTETGKVLDPWQNDTQQHYMGRFASIDTSAWAVAQVPDGTAHGATSDGHGGWVNPARTVPPSPVLPATDDFHALIRAKAQKLFDNGQISAALALLATIN